MYRWLHNDASLNFRVSPGIRGIFYICFPLLTAEAVWLRNLDKEWFLYFFEQRWANIKNMHLLGIKPVSIATRGTSSIKPPGSEVQNAYRSCQGGQWTLGQSILKEWTNRLVIQSGRTGERQPCPALTMLSPFLPSGCMVRRQRCQFETELKRRAMMVGYCFVLLLKGDEKAAYKYEAFLVSMYSKFLATGTDKKHWSTNQPTNEPTNN